MKKSIFRYIGPILGLIIFITATVILYQELKKFNYKDILIQIKSFSSFKILLAFIFTILSYFILTLYDILAFFYIKKPLNYQRVAFTSAISYIFSNNIGLSIFSGSAVRFRFYTALGLSTIDIIKIIAFCFATFWIGLITSCGISFILEPIGIPSILHLPFTSIRSVGFILFINHYNLYIVQYFLEEAS